MPSCFDDLCVVDPSPMARRLLWHVLSVGSAWRDELESHPARDKAGAFLFWVVSGTGELRVGPEAWPLKPGAQVWLVDLGTPRVYVPDEGQRLVTSGIRFSGPALHAWLEALGRQAEFTFAPAAESRVIRQSHRKLMQLARARPAGYEWDIHTAINQILGCLVAQRQVLADSINHKLPAPVARVLDLVLEDPLRDWRAAELAKLAGVSYSGLRLMFRETQHESLMDFLQRTRLHQTRLLLAHDGLSMKEVAARLHFSSEYYFSQWFRRQTGLSPTKFRESLRG